MSTIDHFRPAKSPASIIYDALLEEASHRKERALEEWIEKERLRVWTTARDYAQQHGIPVPTMDQIEREERMAQGHCDYAHKWAVGVHFLLKP